MFGHQNDQDDKTSTDDEVAKVLSGTDSTDTVVEPSSATEPDLPGPPVTHGQMLPTPSPAGTIIDDEDEDASSGTPSAALSSPTTTSTPSLPTGASGDLLDIKQQALQQLSPLVSQLEQTPEEKFRTLMMMIQASDNQSLINDAYKAAQSIDNEKVKAQALLDIVNEINYFTHPHEA